MKSNHTVKTFLMLPQTKMRSVGSLSVEPNIKEDVSVILLLALDVEASLWSR